ncbi:MAG: carboxypeptidase regulatory-like domain-containing protein, partial [Acidobacteria bacterium]|nr:carboxypeptidase regulatory-like domain-containing protein [Acidobacteriota bacterium]
MVPLVLGASNADAQVLYGSVVGNVTDNTGAALPGSTVTVTNKETGAVRETVTDETGAYRVPTLQPGSYRIVVGLTGFTSASRPDVPVTLNTVTRVNMSLQVGEMSETITVEASSPLLQTDRAEVRSELNTRELRDLPVPIGRNYQNLFKVLPGFTPPADAHSVPSNPSRALTFNVNGASRSSNNTRIDGVSTTNIWLPHVVAYVPALESLETVNVVTNSFDAEQGLAGGAAINVQIKSGTNNIRGSAFEYHTNEKLRALNYFAPKGTPKGEWRYNQFGGTVGGPVVRNKLFYFASYEGTRDKQNVSRTLSVPTAALRQGNFSAASNPIYDPMTGDMDGNGRTPFPGNIIPQNRIDPISLRLLQELPLPNLTDPDGSIPEQNNYFVQAPFIFNRWTLDSKVNFNATDKLHVFGRYSVLDFKQDNATVFGDFLQGPPVGGGNPGIGSGK